MAIILKANIVSLFLSSVLFVFWYYSPNFLDTPHIKYDTHILSALTIPHLRSKKLTKRNNSKGDVQRSVRV
jgi:hypothetical protein